MRDPYNGVKLKSFMILASLFRHRYLLAFNSLLLCVVLACSQRLEPIVTPEFIQATPTNAPTETATLSPTPTAVPTLPPAPPLPSPTLVTLPIPPDNLDGLSQWLRDAYPAGATLSQVCNLLQANQWQQPQDSCQEADLNGDQQAEWLLTIDQTRLAQANDFIPVVGHWGDFWVVSATELYKLYASEIYSPEFTAPQLVNLTDMNGDGWLEAIVMFEMCGASTCFNNYYILSASKGQLVNLVLPRPENVGYLTAINLSYVTQEQFQDRTGDGLPDLIIHGGTFGSVGAGPQRGYTEIWAWNGTAIALAEMIWDQSDIRFHRLYDGNFAFTAGDYETAIMAYTETIEDGSLIDTDWLDATEAIRQSVEQFAAFRLVLIALLNNDFAEAVHWLNWLETTYPNLPITQGAGLLVGEWDSNGNQIGPACTAVTAYLSATENPTGQLVDMGYANPTLTGDDLCLIPTVTP